MAKKTNFTNPSGKQYFRTSAVIGHNENGKPIRKQFYASSKREAEAKKQDFLSNLKNETSVKTDLSLNEYMYRWLFDIVKTEIKHSSFNRYEGLYRNYIQDSQLAEMKLIDISVKDIQKFYSTLTGDSRTPDTVKIVHRLLNKLFNYCVKIGDLPSNPNKNTVLPKSYKIESTEIEIFKKDEIAKIRKSVYEDINNFLYLFGLSTGLRAGEIFALTYNDIDINRLTININKSLSFITVIGEEENKREMQITPPKSKNSVRIVPFPEDLVKLYELHKENELKKAKENGIIIQEDSLVFTSTVSKPRNSKQLNVSFRRYLNRLDIEYRKFHTLRHTYCSILAINNVPLKMAAELMGHDIEMTSKIYTHLDLDSKKDAISKINFF